MKEREMGKDEKEFSELKKAKKRVVIVFVDIIGCAEISNNHTIEDYAYILNQFHRAASDTVIFLGLLNPDECELSIRGDEACMILHRGKTEHDEEALKLDARAALLFAISVKYLWHASAYNAERRKNGLIPHDVAVGIHEGYVYHYLDPCTICIPPRDAPSSEGYAINLAKRIESEARNGESLKIMLSGVVKYRLESSMPGLVKFKPHTTDSLKGISSKQTLYEIVDILPPVNKHLKKLLDEKLKFDDDYWKHILFVSKSSPEDVWSRKFVEFKEHDILTLPEQQLPTEPEEVAKLSEEARRYELAGNFNAAVECLSKIPDDKKTFDIYLRRATAYYCMSDYQKALNDFEMVIKLKPNDPYTHHNRGLTLGNLGRYEEEIAACDQAIKFKPDFAEAHHNRGFALGKLGRNEEALVAFEQAIKLRMDFAEAHVNRGIALGNLGRYEDEVAACDQAIKLKPNYPNAHNSRGAALEKLRRYEEAIAACDQAIKLKSDFAEAHCNRGVALEKLGLYEDAIAAYDQAIRHKPDFAEAHNNRGVALGKLGRHEEAIAAYDQAIKLKPDDPEAHNNRGAALEHLGRYEEAIAAYDQAINLKPDIAEIHCNRGNVLGKLERYEEAERAYLEAIKFNEKAVKFYMNLAELYMISNQAAEAQKTLEKAMRLELSESVLVLLNYLECLSYIMLGDPPYKERLEELKERKGGAVISGWNYNDIEKFTAKGPLAPEQKAAFEEATRIMKGVN